VDSESYPVSPSPATLRLGLSISLSLLIVSVIVVAASAIEDLRGRSMSPEATVRRYFSALEAADVDTALEQIAPAARDAQTRFIENGAGNKYRVVGIAVRTPSLLDRFRGAPSTPEDITVFVSVTEVVSGDEWQATPRVPLVQENDRWYLARAPLAPV